MAYADLNTIHNPATGTAPPATWGDQVRDNFERLLARGPYVCTSSTRPASPTLGDGIYETDTGKLYWWSGSAWRAPGNVAWGQVGYAAKTSNQGSITTITDVSSLTATWTAVSGRLYKVSLTGHLEVTNLDTVARLTLAYSTNTQFEIAQSGFTQVNVAETVGCTTYITASGSTTIKARCERVTGTGNVQVTCSSTLPAVLIVEDIGPS